MPYEMHIAQDGILRLSFSDNLDESEMISFTKDIHLYLEAATKMNPVHSLMQVGEIGNISINARKRFIELNQDFRFGNLACIGDNRPFRVLAHFMVKAAERTNIQFFTQEDEALLWLNNNISRNNHHNLPLDIVEGNPK